MSGALLRLFEPIAFAFEGEDLGAVHQPVDEGVASIKKSFGEACKAVGLTGFRFHDLRHTCGSWLMQSGVPAGHIAAVLGHSTVRITERYAHVAPENAEAAVAKLDAVPKIYPLDKSSVGISR